MGNQFEHNKKSCMEFSAMSSQEAKNKGYKEEDFDKVKVLLYKPYAAATWDFHQVINILCPYCFYSEKRDLCIYDFRAEKFREKYGKENSSKREQYTKEMADVVNKGIIENELEFLNILTKIQNVSIFTMKNVKLKEIIKNASIAK